MTDYRKVQKKSCVNCHFLQKNSTMSSERIQPDTDWSKSERETVPPEIAERGYPSCFMGEWNPFLGVERYSAKKLIEVVAETDRSDCAYFEPWQPGTSKTAMKRSREERMESIRNKRTVVKSNWSIILTCVIIAITILKETWLGRLFFQWLDDMLCWGELLKWCQ